MGDLNSHYEALDRSLRRIGIVIVDDNDRLRNGKPAQCIDLLRRLLYFTSTSVAKVLLTRGCPSRAPDMRLVISAFDLVRDVMKFSPSISPDQFTKQVIIIFILLYRASKVNDPSK